VRKQAVQHAVRQQLADEPAREKGKEKEVVFNKALVRQQRLAAEAEEEAARVAAEEKEA
jgi:hypothetical protein